MSVFSARHSARQWDSMVSEISVVTGREPELGMRGTIIWEPEEDPDGVRIQEGPLRTGEHSRSHGRAACALPQALKRTKKAGKSGC